MNEGLKLRGLELKAWVINDRIFHFCVNYYFKYLQMFLQLNKFTN